ncbi:winged helix-turn-helix transcriptional regulator [Streptomyces sp. RK9]|uniref:winged helix-turn-helix transcriptional regulator n=1 Tax=Streptomyces sp. RK9 TaxID=3239284 RepID=UPI0038685D9D
MSRFSRYSVGAITACGTPLSASPPARNAAAPPCLPECGVARFLTLLNGPWATLIVRELLHGPLRFNQLREALPGISPHTLTSRLRQFERHGIVTRTTYAEIPPRVVYALTPLGQGHRDLLEAMGDWALTVKLTAAAFCEELAYQQTSCAYTRKQADDFCLKPGPRPRVLRSVMVRNTEESDTRLGDSPFGEDNKVLPQSECGNSPRGRAS